MRSDCERQLKLEVPPVEQKLVVNEAKSAVRRADESEFLGFAFRTRKLNIAVTTKNLKRRQARVRATTSRNRGVSFSVMLTKQSRYLRGWMGYFGLSSTKRIWPLTSSDSAADMCYLQHFRSARNSSLQT